MCSLLLSLGTAFAQAGLSLCWSHIPHSHAAAQIMFFRYRGTEDVCGFAFPYNSAVAIQMLFTFNCSEWVDNTFKELTEF